MARKFLIGTLVAAVVAPVAVPAPALAYDRHYRGGHHYYHHRCKRSSGTTGLIAGGAGGALLGNALGGGTLGTVAGGVGGALLGRHLDKRHDAAQNRRNGC
jgi:hypothetical protein